MSNNTGATAPSEQPADGPLSLDDLFNAELASSGQSADRPDSPEDLAAPHRVGPGSPVSASSFDTPASSDSPEDPEGIEHEDEADDVDLAPDERDPEDEDEEADDGADDPEIDEEDVDGHAPFADTGDEGADGAEPDAKPDEEVTFADLGLPVDLLRAVTDMGYVTPTAIQREAIPVLLAGRDVVGVAQTGTGKTAAFGLPLLDAVDAREPVVQALVLAPTRELALQSADAIADMPTARAAWTSSPSTAAPPTARRSGRCATAPRSSSARPGALSTSSTRAPWSWTTSRTSSSTRPTRCCAWASPRTSRPSPPPCPRSGAPPCSARPCRRPSSAWPAST